MTVAVPATASSADGERTFDGPLHFCGHNFSLEAASDEKIGYERGPDFDVYSLQSSRGGFGIYEGFAPETFRNSRRTIRVQGFRKVERLKDEEGSYSYLISLPKRPGDGPPSFVHVWGEVWKGDDSDLLLLRRLKVGDSQLTGCNRPTVNELAKQTGSAGKPAQ